METEEETTDLDRLEDLGADEATITTTTTRQIETNDRTVLPMTGEVLPKSKLMRFHECKVSRVRAARGLGGYCGSYPWEMNLETLAEELGAGAYSVMWVDRRGKAIHEALVEIASDHRNARRAGQQPGAANSSAAVQAVTEGHARVYAQLREVNQGVTDQAKTHGELMARESAERLERDRAINDRELQRETARNDAAERRHERDLERERERARADADREQQRHDASMAQSQQFFQQFAMLMKADGSNGTQLVETLAKGIELGQGIEGEEGWVKAIEAGAKTVENIVELKHTNGDGGGSKRLPAGKGGGTETHDAQGRSRRGGGLPPEEMAEYLAFKAECKKRNLDHRELLRGSTEAVREASADELTEMLGEEEEEERDKKPSNGSTQDAPPTQQ